jgi:lipopolysaccharide biosynthesis glycosyltransferase
MLYPANRFSREINVLCCGDEKYAMAMATMIYSASANLSRYYRLRVFVIDGGISLTSRRRIEEKINLLGNVELEWLKNDRADLKDLPTVGHLNDSMYLRLFMGELLPKDVDRVIYLDVDLLVESDLSELWREEFGQGIVLAVRNYTRSIMRSHLPLPGIDEATRRRGRYFNSGVMLVNLNLWREESVGPRAFEYIRRYSSQIEFGDQDGLNAVLFGKWEELDISWNAQVDKLMNTEQLGRGEMYDEIRRRRDELLFRPKIRHYSGAKKPWQAGRFRPVRKAFLRYLHDSRWFDPAELLAFHTEWFLATAKVAYHVAMRKLATSRVTAAFPSFRRADRSTSV